MEHGSCMCRLGRSLALAWAAALSVLSAGPAAADATPVWPAERAARIDALVAAYVPSVLPGLQVAIGQRGRVLFERGYGMADVRTGRPLTAATPMRIGSVSKQFTAATLLLLEQRGQLSLDEPLSHWVPEVRLKPEPTLRQLVQMVGGITGDDEALFGGALAEITEPPLPLTQFLAQVAAQGRATAPGEAYAYSNAGYALLGLVIERATGQPLATAYSQLLFRPAGMASAALVTATPRPQDAVGHFRLQPSDAWLQCPDLNSAFGAAGGIIATAADVLRWNGLLWHGGLLSPERRAAMRTPAQLASGRPAPIAMGLASLGPGVGWGAAGQTVNFAAFNATYDSGWDVVLLANGSNDQRDGLYPRAALAAQIHNLLEPAAPVPPPPPPAADKTDPQALQQLLALCR